jgi:hypothetical protein
MESVRGYEASRKRGGEVEGQFWDRLLRGVEAADIGPETYFFTNALMDLKPGKAPQPSPGKIGQRSPQGRRAGPCRKELAGAIRAVMPGSGFRLPLCLRTPCLRPLRAENPQKCVHPVQVCDIPHPLRHPAERERSRGRGLFVQAMDLDLDRILGPRVAVASPEMLRRLLAYLGANREALHQNDRSHQSLGISPSYNGAS